MNGKKIICLAVGDEPPGLEVLKKFITSVCTLELAGTCVDAIEPMNFLQSNPVDLIFLDIKMPELLGTDFIRALKNPPKVIFTTAFRKYAIEGFELDAVDYLLKPISPRYIGFRSERKMIQVALTDILYIESIKDYIKVITLTNTVLTKQSISTVEELLPKEMFIRIHRSYIVALNKIESYTHELLWIAKTELPISRMYRHEVEKVLH